jgi:hypothetical protein
MFNVLRFVGLRTTPAQMAVVDTRTFQYELVAIGPASETNTIAGHQWTSRNGRFTSAAFEGSGSDEERPANGELPLGAAFGDPIPVG